MRNTVLKKSYVVICIVWVKNSDYKNKRNSTELCTNTKHDQITNTGLEADIFLSEGSCAATFVYIITRNGKYRRKWY